MIDVRVLAPWVLQVVWTVATVGGGSIVGQVLGAVLLSQAPRWLPARLEHPAEPIARLVRRRLPWRGLLVGLWASAAYWPLTPEGLLLIESSMFLVGAVSVRLVKHEFVERLHARFERERIVIPFPIRTIARRDYPREGR